MKIAVNTENYEILNSLIRTAKAHGNTVVIAKLEKSVFNHIESEEINAFILNASTNYAQKAVDFIKYHYPYIPVLIIGKGKKYSIKSADIIIPFEKGNDTDFFAQSALHNIYLYEKNFETLQKLTAKLGENIEFGECVYDPTRRVLFFKGEKVQKLSPKQAGIFELLAANFGQVIKKELILEKVWHQSNYFVGRSLDVFVTHLRKILKEGGIHMTITNVSNVGLMLDHLPKIKK